MSLWLVSEQWEHLKLFLFLIATGMETVYLAAISNHSTLFEGDTAILTCLGYGIPDVEITWRLNGEIIVNSSLVTIYEENVPLQVRGVLKESTLQVCGVRYADTGEYTCTVSGGLASSSASTQLTLVGKYICTDSIDAAMTTSSYLQRER